MGVVVIVVPGTWRGGEKIAVIGAAKSKKDKSMEGIVSTSQIDTVRHTRLHNCRRDAFTSTSLICHIADTSNRENLKDAKIIAYSWCVEGTIAFQKYGNRAVGGIVEWCNWRGWRGCGGCRKGSWFAFLDKANCKKIKRQYQNVDIKFRSWSEMVISCYTSNWLVSLISADAWDLVASTSCTNRGRINWEAVAETEIRVFTTLFWNLACRRF